MSLREYRAKRDFGRTREPEGSVRKDSHGHHDYVIQKHAATRLHYDLRLELDGVLKSWAVPKGPSLDPSERRLAVQVEDHPLEYGAFEGTIPKSEYGGGTVMLWDRGDWEPIGDPVAGYRKGHLRFVLHGEKLHGGWTLVRMSGKAGEEGKNWLLIKMDDSEARSHRDIDILQENPFSVSTGRSMEEIAVGSAPVARRLVETFSSRPVDSSDKRKNLSVKSPGMITAQEKASRTRKKGIEIDSVLITHPEFTTGHFS